MCKDCGRQFVKDRVKAEVTEKRMSRQTSVRESPIYELGLAVLKYFKYQHFLEPRTTSSVSF